MNRIKKLTSLLCILIVACVATFAVSKYEENKEQIQTSGETILTISTDSVNYISWGEDLSFSKEDSWKWETDENFPVDTEKMENLLEIFADIKAAFIIEEPENLSQYGLDNPECTVSISAGNKSYTLTLGDLSEMDSQRYFSMDDGNVYLVSEDPMDKLDITADDLILHDEIPDFDDKATLTFTGTEEYEIVYSEDNTAAYSENDVYFADIDGEYLPLDTDNLEDYISDVSSLSLTDYVTYNVTDELLAECGLDNPQLSITVNYTAETEDETAEVEQFVLHISRDPKEIRALPEADEDSADEDEEITAFARIGDSQIIYELSSDDYLALMAAAYNDLRSDKLFPASFDDVTAMDITLDGETHSITSKINDEDEREFYLNEEKISMASFKLRLTALTATEYTDQVPTGKEEISATFYMDNENHPEIRIELYRQDREKCIGVMNGQTISFISRSKVVDFIEEVNNIVLG